MRATSLDIKEIKLKKKFSGYDTTEVELMRELACGALEDSARKITELKSEVERLDARLKEHEKIERTLKDTISTAHKMYEDLKGTAVKESELIVAEAKLQASDIHNQASSRANGIRTEIIGLKKQRLEIESSIKAVLDYHSNLLELGNQEARKADAELEKLQFLRK